MAKPSTAHELDTRLLRFRAHAGSEDTSRLAADLLGADRAHDAMEVTAAGLRSSPDDLPLLLLDGRAHYASGDLLRAQAALLKAARVAPAQKEPFRWLGEVLLKRGDPQRAMKVLERARAIDADDRVIQTLHARAERLARIADTEGGGAAAEASRAAFERGGSDGDGDERTVVRPELSAQLATGTRAGAAASPFEEEVDTHPELPEEEESPTSLMDRDQLPLARPAARPAAAAPPRAGALPPNPAATRPLAPRAAASPEPPADLPSPGRGQPARPPRTARKATLPLGALAPAQRPAAAAVPAIAAPRAPAPRPGAAPPRASAPPSAGAASTPARARTGSPPTSPSPWTGAPDVPPSASPSAPPAAPPRAPAPRAAPASLPPPPPAADPFAALGTSQDDGPSASSDPFAPPPRTSPVPAAPRASRPLVPATREARASAPSAAHDPRASAPPAAPDPFAAPARASAPPAAPDPFAAPAREARHHEPDDAEIVYDDDAGAPPPEPDLALGARAGEPEDADAILEMLERQGIFEPPTGEVAAWAPRKEARVQGTRVGLWIGIAWVLTIGAGVGVWYGWQAFVEDRHARAALLVAQASEEARAGDHERLVDAERHLRAARELDPREASNPTVLLFVHAQLALEDGSFEVGYLRPTLARAERMDADPRWLHAARAVMAAGEGDQDAARLEVAHAIEGDDVDAGLLYVAGRIEQRLGDEHALEHLQQAIERDPQLTSAAIALAEARYDEGRPEDAIALLDGVLQRDERNLRAQLWKAFLTADERDPAEALTALGTLEERLEHGAATDHVLTELTRARLLRRQGEHERAGEAVGAALEAGAQEPRLLALMARAAVSAGRLLQAEYAATAAVRGSPSNADFRKLLANIYLDRRNGPRALATLAQLPADDPDVILMTGRAAILVGTEEAITGAAAALDRYVEEHEDAGLELRALRIRIGLLISEPGPMLAAARQLARDNPGDPVASLALGEAALRARDAETAVRALEQVAQASPDDAEGHHLLGRARRMQGDGEGARRSFERALELRPELAEAKLALGLLLLDLGDYEAAEALYVELARAAGSAAGMTLSVAGRLGRVEALIGRGELDDAQVQLEGVRDGDRETAAARTTAARLALARGRSGDAIRELRALVPEAGSEERAAPTVLALYGDALLAAGEVEASAAAYEQALAGDSDLPEALIGRAELYVRADHARDAAPLLERAARSLEVRIRPPSLRARKLMLDGRVALASRDADTARAKLREATALPGVPAEAYFHLGEALAGDNAPEARAAYDRYLELAPDGPLASRARRATSGR